MKFLPLILCALLLASCAGLPPRTYSIYGETKDGTRIGGSVALGDTRIRKDK